MFNTLKDKRFWILLFPSVIVFVLLTNYITDESTLITFVVIFIIIFWGIYLLWEYIDKKRK